MAERLTEPDMEAAQQLVQLTGGEEDESQALQHNDSQTKKEEEGEESRRAEISGRGKEEEVEEDHRHRPRKRQRFRSLASNYKMTGPVNNGHRGHRIKKRMQRD